MALSTAFTELFGLRHPIALAPLGGFAGGALTAAVSNAGGLGLLGGGNGDREWPERELPIAAAGTGRPWRAGFQSWAGDGDTVSRALEFGPRAIDLITDLLPAADVVADLAAQAEDALTQALGH